MKIYKLNISIYNKSKLHQYLKEELSKYLYICGINNFTTWNIDIWEKYEKYSIILNVLNTYHTYET